MEDDRGMIRPGDRVMLIVEDDPGYARVLREAARAQGFKAIIAITGGTALNLARELKPVAITLDVHLPDMDGWQVLNRLKVDLATRHIPIHVITVDEDTRPGLDHGAWGCLTKGEEPESLNQALNGLKQFVDRPV
jgi:CheY-like chemotaxis protein